MGNFIILSITAVILGPSASGILRAVSTLFLPISQFASAIGSLLVPRLAEVGASRSTSRLRTAALQTIGTLGAIATTYSVVMLIFGKEIIVFVYNKPEITSASRLLWPFSIYAILDAIIAAMAIVLVANAVTRFMFWARLASVSVFLSSAICLSPAIGLDAIVWAAAAGSAICAYIHGLALATVIRQADGRIQGASVRPMKGA
jgi:O-antigen/teichoic acid export membrane protein